MSIRSMLPTVFALTLLFSLFSRSSLCHCHSEEYAAQLERASDELQAKLHEKRQVVQNLATLREEVNSLEMQGECLPMVPYSSRYCL